MLDERRYLCDRSGKMVDKVYKQYEWKGNRKVWTGLMVAKEYLDIPNDQGRSPLIKKDPIPLSHSRPFIPGEEI
jgi:hypothetical protein